MLKQIICINWGTKYGPDYVNRLYGMVSRNITPPFTFTCFCDNPDGMRPEVRTEPLPELDFVMPTGTKGIWPKARLWSEKLADLQGPVLFMDLDLVVIGNMDAFFEHGSPEDVILGRNPNTPFEKLGQTSLFRFPVGKLLPLQEKFLADPQTVADEYQFEQRYVTRNAPGGVSFWPRGWLRHFRMDCARSFPMNYVLPPKKPADAKVIIFPGGLLPTHAIEGYWGRHHKPGSRMDHIRRLADPDRHDKPLRHLRHFILPSKWVEEAWRA
ncbi:glycosyl transferase [Amaricoccus tamworthensis]|uniref:glycosyl transferase n=1 Tax=Amaricoccus tamworthensis TaxID=57002 RepID=UPI003C7DFF05